MAAVVVSANGLGTIGIDPALAIALSPFVIPQPSGVGAVTLTVPNQPSLAGAAVFAQAVLMSTTLPTRLTNVPFGVIPD